MYQFIARFSAMDFIGTIMDNNDRFDFFETLINTPTPTGSEEAGMLLLGKRIKEKTGIQPEIDIHGNLHAFLKAGSNKTIMLEGHCDEIGYMVEYIDSNGFVYFQPLGGIIVPLTAAERITILSKKGPINGVIGTRPPHLMSADEKKKVAADDLKLLPCDIGATSKEEAESLVSIGDPAIVATGYRKLAGSRISGRGMDNRAGAFAMCEAFIEIANIWGNCSLPSPYNVHFVASVCEEIGLVGGKIASYNVNPDIGISCDVAFATDAHNGDAKVVGDIKLGKGGALAIGPIYHKGLAEHFKSTAEKSQIPMQLRGVPKGTGNNGWALKMERGGAAVVQIGLPLRYMHTPVEVVDTKDIEAVIQLVVKSTLSLPSNFDLLPKQP